MAGTVLEILVEEGETVEVGTEICVIGSERGATATPPDSTAEAPAETPTEEPEPAEEPADASERTAPEAPAASGRIDERGRLLSPVVRKLVRENDIDVSRIEGTGVGGRVTRKDVEAHLESREAEPEPAVPTAEPAPTPEPAPAAEPEREAAPAPSAEAEPALAAAGEPEAEGVVTEPLPRLRARIAENMIRAKQTAAHVWTSVEVDYERVERVRRAHREEFKQSEGFSLTYLPFIARATIDALGEFEAVNSSLDLEEKTRTFHRAVHLGVAIDLDQGGLVVATLRDADGLRLVGLARGIRRLAEKARSGKLDPDDVSGSTFTITNPGPFGSFMSAPIINVPNTGILSTETVAKRPAVITGPDGDDVIAIRHIGYLGLTWDHRAFDGSTAVLFLQRIKQNLETWDWEQELG